MGKMFDKKLQQIQNGKEMVMWVDETIMLHTLLHVTFKLSEDAAVASLRHLGRWNYVLNKLTIASQTSSNPELTELITSLEKDVR